MSENSRASRVREEEVDIYAVIAFLVEYRWRFLLSLLLGLGVGFAVFSAQRTEPSTFVSEVYVVVPKMMGDAEKAEEISQKYNLALKSPSSVLLGLQYLLGQHQELATRFGPSASSLDAYVRQSLSSTERALLEFSPTQVPEVFTLSLRLPVKGLERGEQTLVLDTANKVIEAFNASQRERHERVKSRLNDQLELVGQEDALLTQREAEAIRDYQGGLSGIDMKILDLSAALGHSIAIPVKPLLSAADGQTNRLQRLLDVAMELRSRGKIERTAQENVVQEAALINTELGQLTADFDRKVQAIKAERDSLDSTRRTIREGIGLGYFALPLLEPSPISGYRKFESPVISSGAGIELSRALAVFSVLSLGIALISAIFSVLRSNYRRIYPAKPGKKLAGMKTSEI